MRGLILMLGFLALLAPTAWAFNASTTSYDLQTFHLGSSGANGSSASYSFRSTLTFEQGGTLNSSSTNYSQNIGWFQAVQAVAVGEPGTNITVWNGFAWMQASAFTPRFNCFITETGFLDWCQPSTQNNDTSQAIYRVWNNGTGSASCLQGKVNETKTWVVLALGNDTAASAYNLTTSYATVYNGVTVSGGYRDVYAWIHTIAFPSSDRRWKIVFNYTNSGC